MGRNAANGSSFISSVVVSAGSNSSSSLSSLGSSSLRFQTFSIFSILLLQKWSQTSFFAFSQRLWKSSTSSPVSTISSSSLSASFISCWVMLRSSKAIQVIWPMLGPEQVRPDGNSKIFWPSSSTKMNSLSQSRSAQSKLSFIAVKI